MMMKKSLPLLSSVPRLHHVHPVRGFKSTLDPGRVLGIKHRNPDGILLMHHTTDREPVQDTLAREPAHRIMGTAPAHQIMDTEPTHQTTGTEAMGLPMDMVPIRPAINTSRAITPVVAIGPRSITVLETAILITTIKDTVIRADIPSRDNTSLLQDVPHHARTSTTLCRVQARMHGASTASKSCKENVHTCHQRFSLMNTLSQRGDP